MKSRLTLLLFFVASYTLCAQDKTLPYYYQIPPYPETYTAASVVARMIDGVGFRYFWATEGLRTEDLSHKPSKEARTSLETLAHIYGLSNVIVNSIMKVPTLSGAREPILSFVEMRKQTLENFKSASDRLKTSTDSELNDFKIVFKNDKGSSEFPFWNQLNGPIADVLWHVGQVVSFRRSSGNPINPKVEVFTGTLSK
ncbi:MAG TPA: hypothetical protein VK517_06065 [Cyclobacteriaceae bacterium]|nr:hypothetical protein [Cyclobacteriaceae bacterium]